MGHLETWCAEGMRIISKKLFRFVSIDYDTDDEVAIASIQCQQMP